MEYLLDQYWVTFSLRPSLQVRPLYNSSLAGPKRSVGDLGCYSDNYKQGLFFCIPFLFLAQYNYKH